MWVKGYLNGKLVRRSLQTTNWQIAAQRVAAIEMNGSPEPTVPQITVGQAVERFLNDAKDRELRPATLKKFRVLLSRQAAPDEEPNRFSPSLIMFAVSHRIEFLKEFTPDRLMEFRQSWKDRGISKLKKSERLKSFFSYARDVGWLSANPARSLKPPKINDPGVVPFSRDQVERIMAACTDERLKTFLLVMRFSGLAIADAVQLTPDRVQGDHLILRRTKTGKHIKVLLPGTVLQRLKALPPFGGRFYFWNRQTDESDVQTATGNMRRSLRRIFEAASVPNAHPHQFRHFFVKEHLEHNVTLETIADLLGNSIKIIEKHYSNWVPSRQRKLDDAVERVWDLDELEQY